MTDRLHALQLRVDKQKCSLLMLQNDRQAQDQPRQCWRRHWYSLRRHSGSRHSSVEMCGETQQYSISFTKSLYDCVWLDWKRKNGQICGSEVQCFIPNASASDKWQPQRSASMDSCGKLQYPTQRQDLPPRHGSGAKTAQDDLPLPVHDERAAKHHCPVLSLSFLFILFYLVDWFHRHLTSGARAGPMRIRIVDIRWFFHTPSLLCFSWNVPTTPTIQSGSPRVRPVSRAHTHQGCESFRFGTDNTTTPLPKAMPKPMPKPMPTPSANVCMYAIWMAYGKSAASLRVWSFPSWFWAPNCQFVVLSPQSGSVLALCSGTRGLCSTLNPRNIVYKMSSIITTIFIGLFFVPYTKLFRIHIYYSVNL